GASRGVGPPGAGRRVGHRRPPWLEARRARGRALRALSHHQHRRYAEGRPTQPLPAHERSIRCHVQPGCLRDQNSRRLRRARWLLPQPRRRPHRPRRLGRPGSHDQNGHPSSAVSPSPGIPRPGGSSRGSALAVGHAAVQRRADEDLRPACRSSRRCLFLRRLELGVQHGGRCLEQRAAGDPGARGARMSGASKKKVAPARHSVLLADGTLAAGARPRMEEEFLLEALRWMMKSRLYDSRVIGLQRQGQFGVYSPGTGQEASIIGSAMAVDPARDWMVPQYRELMATVPHGLPLEVIPAQSLGKIGAARIPDGVNVLPTQVSIAAQLPQATGLAWGLKLRGEDSVVLTYIGEGGSSEGDFHEALNLAGTKKAPIVFFLSNNQWAISTSRKVQSATPSFALR